LVIEFPIKKKPRVSQEGTEKVSLIKIVH